MQYDANLVIFYVSSIERSAHWYAKLLNSEPIHSEPTYVMFLLKPGLRLGLWLNNTVEPQPTSVGGGAELALEVDNDQTIDALFIDHKKHDFTVIQPPTPMDFGYTFTLCDPDNHRVRFFAKR